MIVFGLGLRRLAQIVQQLDQMAPAIVQEMAVEGDVGVFGDQAPLLRARGAQFGLGLLRPHAPVGENDEQIEMGSGQEVAVEGDVGILLGQALLLRERDAVFVPGLRPLALFTEEIAQVVVAQGQFVAVVAVVGVDIDQGAVAP